MANLLPELQDVKHQGTTNTNILSYCDCDDARRHDAPWWRVSKGDRVEIGREKNEPRGFCHVSGKGGKLHTRMVQKVGVLLKYGFLFI